jgi:hypothetical protein
MSSLDQSFKVKIDIGDEKISKMLSDTCQKVEFIQSVSNKSSESEFVFKLKALYNDAYMPEDVPKKVVKGASLKFQILSLSDEPQTKLHDHVIVDMRMRYTMRGSGFVLHLLTREKFKNDMSINNISAAYSYERLSDMVEAILKRNGLKVKKIETTAKIPEFSTLRQPYITDLAFITSEINPRAISESGSAGYCLFTTDGKDAIWSTIGFECKDKDVSDEMILSVEPQRSQWPAEQGSVSHSIIGFNLDTKLITSASSGPDVTPSYGTLSLPKPYDKSSTTSNISFMRSDAVKAYAARCQYLEAYTAFPFIVGLRGSEGWDDVPYNVKVPRIHDQGGGELKGYVSSIRHVYALGEYRIFLTALRDKGKAL